LLKGDTLEANIKPDNAIETKIRFGALELASPTRRNSPNFLLKLNEAGWETTPSISETKDRFFLWTICHSEDR